MITANVIMKTSKYTVLHAKLVARIARSSRLHRNKVRKELEAEVSKKFKLKEAK